MLTEVTVRLRNDNSDRVWISSPATVLFLVTSDVIPLYICPETECASRLLLIIYVCLIVVCVLHFLLSNETTSGEMVSVLTSSAEDCGFEPRSGQTKDYNIGICCFSTRQAALKRKSKDGLARNQDNMSEWGDMSICCFSELAL
jgi:hypothetical protein